MQQFSRIIEFFIMNILYGMVICIR